MSKGEQRVPVRVDSALGRTLGQGSEPQGVRAPKTQRTRSGWMRDVLDRRPLEVDPDPGVDPHKQKGLPESPPGEPQRGNERKSHPSVNPMSANQIGLGLLWGGNELSTWQELKRAQTLKCSLRLYRFLSCDQGGQWKNSGSFVKMDGDWSNRKLVSCS